MPGLKRHVEELFPCRVSTWKDSDFATVNGAVEYPQGKASYIAIKQKMDCDAYREVLKAVNATGKINQMQADYVTRRRMELGLSLEVSESIETEILGKRLRMIQIHRQTTKDAANLRVAPTSPTVSNPPGPIVEVTPSIEQRANEWAKVVSATNARYAFWILIISQVLLLYNTLTSDGSFSRLGNSSRLSIYISTAFLFYIAWRALPSQFRIVPVPLVIGLLVFPLTAFSLVFGVGPLVTHLYRKAKALDGTRVGFEPWEPSTRPGTWYSISCLVGLVAGDSGVGWITFLGLTFWIIRTAVLFSNIIEEIYNEDVFGESVRKKDRQPC
jgi:hypothetical protein